MPVDGFDPDCHLDESQKTMKSAFLLRLCRRGASLNSSHLCLSMQSKVGKSDLLGRYDTKKKVIISLEEEEEEEEQKEAKCNFGWQSPKNCHCHSFPATETD